MDTQCQNVNVCACINPEVYGRLCVNLITVGEVNRRPWRQQDGFDVPLPLVCPVAAGTWTDTGCTKLILRDGLHMWWYLKHI